MPRERKKRQGLERGHGMYHSRLGADTDLVQYPPASGKSPGGYTVPGVTGPYRGPGYSSGRVLLSWESGRFEGIKVLSLVRWGPAAMQLHVHAVCRFFRCSGITKQIT